MIKFRTVRGSLLTSIFYFITVFITAAAQPMGTQRSPTLQSIYRPNSGVGVSGLIADFSGNFYGAEIDDGPKGESSVFKLSPPSNDAGRWKLSTLYVFSSGDIGEANISGLAIDRYGNLYGTAGTWHRRVFELIPPHSGHEIWSEKSLVDFPNGIGGPEAVTVDPEGDLLGTSHSTALASGNVMNINSVGTFFELKPPATKSAKWSGSILYTFQGSPLDGAFPQPGLLRGTDGSLYGVSSYGGNGSDCPVSGPSFFQGCGTVFRLTPPTLPNGSWHEKVLYNFNGFDNGAFPNSPLAMDKEGALYGWAAAGKCLGSADPNEQDYGLVFELTPSSRPDGSWTENVLHRFTGPPDGKTDSGVVAPLTLDAGRNVYGTTPAGGTHDDGTIFKLTPPPDSESDWRETILYSFDEKNGNGAFPAAYGLVGINGSYIGTTLSGGNKQRCGTIYKITP